MAGLALTWKRLTVRARDLSMVVRKMPFGMLDPPGRILATVPKRGESNAEQLEFTAISRSLATAAKSSRHEAAAQQAAK